MMEGLSLILLLFPAIFDSLTGKRGKLQQKIMTNLFTRREWVEELEILLCYYFYDLLFSNTNKEENCINNKI